MIRKRTSLRFAWQRVRALGLLGCATLFAIAAIGKGQKASQGMSGFQEQSAAIAEGRQAFESRCSICHGLDGRGTERAPDLVTRATVQQRTNAELFKIIQDGVPASGMPSFGTMDPMRINALVSYLRLLQGKIGGTKIKGDAKNGKALFYGKARCAECHMMAGAGGYIASDLSSYGRTRAPEEIRDAILKPARESGTYRGVVTVTLRDGQKFSGVLRNEDNFSLQMQTLDGAFHLFVKAEVESVARPAEPLMPSNYASVLSQGEIDDLISYMMAARGGKSETASGTKRNWDDEDED